MKSILLTFFLALTSLCGQAQIFSNTSSDNPWMWNDGLDAIREKAEKLDWKEEQTKSAPYPIQTLFYRAPIPNNKIPQMVLFTFQEGKLVAITWVMESGFSYIIKSLFTKKYTAVSDTEWVDLAGRARILKEETVSGKLVSYTIRNIE